MQRDYGYYANRTRGARRKTDDAAAAPSHDRVPPGEIGPSARSVTMVEPQLFSRIDLRRRWAALIGFVYEVEPLECPRCGGEMRVIAPIH